ncbi:MAG: CapA family protein [Bacteroidales bacterium]|jgi:poly-gamma-glutamate synthesis protein (capsule biosynthesis protein)|nr:CapA family protein [Bacteroidales bacterium]
MEKIRIILLFGVACFALCLAPFFAAAADCPPVQDHCERTDTLRMIFAGDVMGHGMQITGAWRDGGDTAYCYHPVFRYVKDYISSADVAVANLEVTLAGAPYRGYPEFSSHLSLAVALQDAGFDVLATANNHSLDRRKQGLERTIDVLDSLGIRHTGTFKDSAAWRQDYPLLVERKGFRLAFLNYTYGTNGIAVESPNVINRNDTMRMAADLLKARALQPDVIITFIHWGEEYRNRENAAQQQLARFLARGGSHLIIGAHPHVVQPFAKIPATDRDSAAVIYSLGNFVSNQRDRYRNGGIVLDVTLVKTDSVVRVASCGYEPFWVHRFPENSVSVFRLIAVNDFLRGPSKYIISETNRKLMMQFYEDLRLLLPNLPFSGYYRPEAEAHDE